MSIQVMTWVFRQTLPPREKVAALAIADEADDTGLCFTRNSLLAAKASLSPGTFKRAVKQLVEWGMLETKPQFTVTGRQTTNLIQLRIDRDVPFEVAEAVKEEGSKFNPTPAGDSENATKPAPSDGDPMEGVQIGPLANAANSGGEGVNLNPTGGSQLDPSGESTADSPITRFNTPSLNSAAVVPNFGSVKPPPLPVRKAAGSAGEQETIDRDSSQFIAEQFERLKTIYQQFNKATFIGSEPLPWAKFRKLPFEKRHEAETKLPLYFKGFNAAYARWQTAKPSERGPKPKCASLRDYICGEMFEKIGWPSAPVAPPKPPPAAWCAAIKSAPRSQFDEGAVFVQAESQSFRDWKAAERRAGAVALGARKFVRRAEDSDQIAWSGYGLFYASETPPSEEDFEDRIAGRTTSGGDPGNRTRGAA
jgi:hypothetical protein